ncbi:hypothetical protein CANINC_002739 [Pichia inconspicua]|uniref:Endoplasmic reticulum lectin n=1 Tax=Pichia inconspicua TaxID=52247 RepID=A0A4T0X0I4_9ASCO|nr:hypothetical protein CANINC_002739 [[Candida] inconspicua]
MFDKIEFECYIPVIENIEVDSRNLHNDPNTMKQEKDVAIDAIRNFHLTHRNTSVTLDSGYWRYMLRFDHDILQLHSEANVDGSIFINHFKLASWSDNDDPFSLETIPYFIDKGASDPYKFESDFELINSEDMTKYVTQRLGNGEICDLTGIPRTTIINYKCNEKASAPVLKNIHEWRTCDYVMDLEASYFCRWPMWSSTSSALKSNIECFPNEEVLDSQYPERLSLQDSELKPLKTGIFFVKKRHSPYKFDILLTKKYDELDQLLYDITEGIRKKIKLKKLVLRESDKSIYLPSLTRKFTIGYDIYDFDLSFLGTVQIENDSNGIFISKLVDLNLPENTNCLDCNH